MVFQLHTIHLLMYSSIRTIENNNVTHFCTKIKKEQYEVNPKQMKD